MGRKISLAHDDSQRRLTSLQASEVFFNREVLDQERNERVLGAWLVLETGNELALAIVVVINVHAVDIEVIFDELGHSALR